MTVVVAAEQTQAKRLRRGVLQSSAASEHEICGERLPLPVVCVAGRSLIDEAAAIMLGQLTTAHGLAARVEAAEALSTTNIFQLETAGVAIVCLVYMDAGSPAHMRYSVRRLRRKSPKATIILGCWLKDMDPSKLETLREGAQADLAAASLGEALRLCIEATGVEDHLQIPIEDQGSSRTAA